MIANAANAYQQTQVMTANRVQLIVLLYDSAIQSLELAREAILTNNYKDKARFLDRSIAIAGELSSVLDFERGGEIAVSLHRLYDYMVQQCIQANLRHNGTRCSSQVLGAGRASRNLKLVSR